MKILFVCLGNICRSPLAQALFEHKVRQSNVAGQIRADSCGTGNYNLGCAPDPRTQRNARTHGIQLDHEARHLRPSDFEEFDRIFVMDRENLKSVRSISDPGHHAKIDLIRLFDPLGIGDVPDPYYGGDDDFQEVFDMLDRSIDALVRQLALERKD